MLRLQALKNLKLGTLKRQGRVTVSIYTDVNTPLEFTIERGGRVVISRVKRMPAGSSRLAIALPKRQIRRGRYRVTVRATNAALRAVRQFSVR